MYICICKGSNASWRISEPVRDAFVDLEMPLWGRSSSRAQNLNPKPQTLNAGVRGSGDASVGAEPNLASRRHHPLPRRHAPSWP